MGETAAPGIVGESGGGGKEVIVKPAAFELAKGWLQKMSGGDDFDAEKDDDASIPEPEARPLRLGLGAKFIPHTQAALPIASPVSKRLRKQIENGKRESDQLEAGPGENEAAKDEEEESRTNAFTKNKVLQNQAMDIQATTTKKKKKKKKKQKLQE